MKPCRSLSSPSPPQRRPASVIAVTCCSDELQKTPCGVDIDDDLAREVLNENCYFLVRLVDNGSFSNVYDALHTKSNRKLAVKLLKREQYMLDEVEALRQLRDCPQIIQFVDTFEYGEYAAIVTELGDGGTLFDAVAKARDTDEFTIPIEDAGIAMARVVQGVAYMHTMRNFVHRDLKLDNVVLMHKGDYRSATIIDFGLAARSMCSGYCESLLDAGKAIQCGGTLDYVAPEMLTHQENTQATDMWCIGVMLYMLFTGHPPFTRTTKDDDKVPDIAMTFNSIVERLFLTPIEEIPNIPGSAIYLLQLLLSEDRTLRPTATECLENSWLTQFVDVTDNQK